MNEGEVCSLNAECAGERERERERERAKSVRLFGDDVKKFSFVHVSPIHQRKSDQNASSSSDNALGFIPHMHYTEAGFFVENQQS
jgi:hypothetical protein